MQGSLKDMLAVVSPDCSYERWISISYNFCLQKCSRSLQQQGCYSLNDIALSYDLVTLLYDYDYCFVEFLFSVSVNLLFLPIKLVLRRSIVWHSIEFHSTGADFGSFPTLDRFGTIGSII